MKCEGLDPGKEYQSHRVDVQDTQSPRIDLLFSAFARQDVQGTVPQPRGSRRGSVVRSRRHPLPFVHVLRCRDLLITVK